MVTQNHFVAYTSKVITLKLTLNYNIANLLIDYDVTEAGMPTYKLIFLLNILSLKIGLSFNKSPIILIICNSYWNLILEFE